MRLNGFATGSSTGTLGIRSSAMMQSHAALQRSEAVAVRLS